LEGGPPCFPQTHRGSWYSGSQPGPLAFPYRALTLSGGAFQRLRVTSRPLLLVLQPLPVPCETTRFGLFPPRSPLLRESRLISLRRATEMFQFAHCPSLCLFHSAGDIQTSLWMGCPIRILRALRSHAAPPERFAGLRVLLRPSAPRHPPRTLSRLCFPALSLSSSAHLTPLLVTLTPPRLVPGTHALAFPLLLSSLFLPWQY
jgi:hypothetical protein